MTIHIPTLAEARQLLGTDVSLNFSRQALNEQAVSHLIAEINNSKASIDERFDAALALRERELPQSAIRMLFSKVVASTKPDQSDGTPGYGLAEKHLGILAAIALQGSVMKSPDHAPIVRAWVRDGMRADVERDVVTTRSENRNDDTACRSASILHGEKIDKFFRALVLLGGSFGQENDVSLLTEVLRQRSISDEAKIFAIRGMVGLEHASVGLTYALVLTDSQTSEFLRGSILDTLSIYLPQSEPLREVLQQLKEVCTQFATTEKLSLGDPRSAKELEGKIERALNPRYTQEQAEVARRQVAAEVWRPILHLKSFESLLVGMGNGNLLEIAPPGTLGDLMTVESIRL